MTARLSRRRELGILRAVGGFRRQIRGTIWLEAIAIGIIGLALGLVMGALNLYYELQAIQTDISGMVLDYSFPLGVVGRADIITNAAGWRAMVAGRPWPAVKSVALGSAGGGCNRYR